MDRPDDLHDLESALLDGIAALAPGGDQGTERAELLRSIFAAQVQSRVLDHTARWLRGSGRGFYTIGSAGHESNAAVAAALRLTDPALLHYRSGGFYCARALQRPGHDGVRDVLAGLQKSGLTLRVEGTGRLASMDPMPGTWVVPGETVQLRFQ